MHTDQSNAQKPWIVLYFYYITHTQILSIFGPGSGLPAPALAAAKLTFSVTQIVTAVIVSIPVPFIKAALDRSGN